MYGCAGQRPPPLLVHSIPRITLDKLGQPINLSEDDLIKIANNILGAYAPSTRETYGMGLYAYHLFCNEKRVLEEQQAPASSVLILAFVSSLIGIYSASTVQNYVFGVRAWHIIHGAQWSVNDNELDALLKSAGKSAPASLKWEKRAPVTINYMTELHKHLNPDDPLHDGVTDPEAALKAHMCINNPPVAGPLFAYRYTYLTKGKKTPKMTYRVLTQSKFLEFINKVARLAGMEVLKGHSIQIGAALEYLLRGTPFNVVKVKGRWASNAFLVYLQKHAQILVLYIQAHSAQNEEFIRIVMPGIQRQ
ncbi:hypothetical protein FA15DRAFT_707116 [Coprinopsis marcescibilis]|uniref:Uncharacterized protein n=1 Tax=Coprinopsis marcescibilis TaxID=230819 RepID=A0A5C3KMZ9_COPMA|nr:hypothetical protein FA15DRAFT_707116 [Coprinopsis marcescibilis]